MNEYLITKKAAIGPCMDVRGYDGRLYAIGKQNGGRLYVLADDLTLLHTVDGLGEARQIEIKDGIAAISARANGLWLFDVREAEPRLLARYQTIELATGITMWRNFVFVSCRQYGVEIVDIAAPTTPRYAGVIRIGEVQSACVYNDVLYGGVWGAMKVVAVDVADITAPRVIAEIPLEGRGDGVVARDGRLYAVTGQHRRGLVNTVDETDPCFGMGNGVEVFDIADPATPKRIFADNFGYGHCISYDMWKPMLCGETLLCCDSVLGVFGYDASLTRQFHFSLPEVDGQPDPVTGMTAMGGRLYVTSAYGGLYVFDGLAFADPYRHDVSGAAAAFTPPFTCTAEGSVELVQRVSGDFPVLAVAEMGDCLVLAGGADGIRLLDRQTFSLIAHVPTAQFCCDVRAHGDCIFAACDADGLVIFRRDNASVTRLISLTFPEAAVQLALSPDGTRAAVIGGSSWLYMVDVRDPAAPVELCSRRAKQGLLYGENFLAHPLKGMDMMLFWHRDGLLWTGPGEDSFREIVYGKRRGFCGYCPGNGCDTDGETVYMTEQGGYVALPVREGIFVDELPVYRTERKIRGKLSICGDRMAVTERAEGIVTLLDVRDRAHPVWLGDIRTTASPGRAIDIDGRIFIPGRYAGLLELREKS